MPTSTAKQNQLDLLTDRAERLAARLARARRIERRYPWARLAVFLAGSLGVITAFTGLPGLWGWLALLVFFGVFGWVAALHRRVLDTIARYETLDRLAAQQQARATLDWAAIPAAPPVSLPKEHPFAVDLDISGERSLHRLVDSAASLGGSQRLMDWLTARAPALALIVQRQQAVRELLPRPALRARLALAGANIVRWDGEPLLRWLDQRSHGASLRPYLLILSALALLNAGLFVYALVTGAPPFWLISLAVFWGVQGMKYRETSELFGEASELARALQPLRAALTELERYPYPPGSALAGLCAPFTQPGARPSRALRRLSLIITGASFRSNAILGLLLNTLLPWDMFFTYQLEKMKAALAGMLPRWLDAWYTLEALLSLAGFAALNPDYTFPTVEPGAPALDAQAIAHPLIPEQTRVPNDFSIAAPGEIFIITGSNMSGKSTFLRTLGLNLALAYAGGVVCAQRLRVIPFRLFTSINLSDSLNDGISYFYAEVRRLRALLDALEQPNDVPLFFLIDEIFRGTNNRERQIGSMAYTQALTGKNGSGLISTHDLELAHLAEQNPAIRNLHFREDVRDGRMVFDYRLRPGPSPTTNALKIMALEGLPVEPR